MVHFSQHYAATEDVIPQESNSSQDDRPGSRSDVAPREQLSELQLDQAELAYKAMVCNTARCVTSNDLLYSSATTAWASTGTRARRNKMYCDYYFRQDEHFSNAFREFSELNLSFGGDGSLASDRSRQHTRLLGRDEAPSRNPWLGCESKISQF
jgi:hypothetical protein